MLWLEFRVAKLLRLLLVQHLNGHTALGVSLKKWRSVRQENHIWVLLHRVLPGVRHISNLVIQSIITRHDLTLPQKDVLVVLLHNWSVPCLLSSLKMISKTFEPVMLRVGLAFQLNSIALSIYILLRVAESPRVFVSWRIQARRVIIIFSWSAISVFIVFLNNLPRLARNMLPLRLRWIEVLYRKGRQVLLVHFSEGPID